MKTTLLFTLLCAVMAFAACKKEGCTDSTAANYYDKANVDNGSCVYTYTCCYYDENGVKYVDTGFECLVSDMSKQDKQQLEADANESVAVLGWSFKCE